MTDDQQLRLACAGLALEFSKLPSAARYARGEPEPDPLERAKAIYAWVKGSRDG